MARYPFKQRIRTEDDLRTIIGHPSQIVTNTVSAVIDDLCQAFIAKSPFVLIASADANGNADLSPKGDPPGFVQLLDDHTLLIPHRPGNRRADTLTNILQNPRVALIFLVPGRRETLRITGTAQLVQDDDLREQCAINGKLPTLLIAVHVEKAFFHCAKCIIRSELWAHDPALDAPTLADAILQHGKFNAQAEQVQTMLEEDNAQNLY